MALSDEEKTLFERLTAKAKESDDDDDEIEWWEESDKGRRGGRMTVKRAKSTGLFADLFGDKTPPEGGKGGSGEKGGGKEGDNPPKGTAAKYFGKD